MIGISLKWQRPSWYFYLRPWFFGFPTKYQKRGYGMAGITILGLTLAVEWCT